MFEVSTSPQLMLCRRRKRKARSSSHAHARHSVADGSFFRCSKHQAESKRSSKVWEGSVEPAADARNLRVRNLPGRIGARRHRPLALGLRPRVVQMLAYFSSLAGPPSDSAILLSTHSSSVPGRAESPQDDGRLASHGLAEVQHLQCGDAW
jgi:hypothetical protein